VQPLNVMYGGQPAVTVPTDVPEAATDGGAASYTGAGVKQSLHPDTFATKAPPLAGVDTETREQVAHEIASRVRGFFERQERTIVSEHAGKSRKARAKWDDELRTDLFLVSDTASRSVGFLTAGLLRGKYDHGRTLQWLSANADRIAKAVNAHTFDAIDAATDLDEVRHVFDVAKTARADQLGRALSTVLVNFGRVEAGRHTGRPLVKTWTPTTENSRHADLAGQTVPVDEPFSNGARFPGDPNLDADDAAGCNCQIEIGEAPA
jgi:hypothetical protein